MTAALRRVARESELEPDERRGARLAWARPLEAPAAALTARGTLRGEPPASMRLALAPLGPVVAAVKAESTVAVALPVASLVPPADPGKPPALGAAACSVKPAVTPDGAPGAPSAEPWVAAPWGPALGPKADPLAPRVETVP